MNSKTINGKRTGSFNTGGMHNYIYSNPNTGKYTIVELDYFKHAGISSGKYGKEPLKTFVDKAVITPGEKTPIVIIEERSLTPKDVVNFLQMSLKRSKTK